MAQQLQVLPITDIDFSWEVYPRTSTYWYLANKYRKMMDAGVHFDAITVTKLDGKTLLVDGWHRLEAHRLRKETEIEVQFKECASLDEVLIAATEINASHGAPLSFQDLLRVATQLVEDYKYTYVQASAVVHIDAKELKQHMRQRKMATKDEHGRPGIVKAPFKRSVMKPQTEDAQKIYMTRTQVSLLRQTVDLFENGYINLDDPVIIGLVEKLADILRGMDVHRGKRAAK
jgi:hypothetical protein